MLAFLLLTAQVALGADQDGRFAIKGAGVSPCSSFVQAYDNQERDELRIYGGWIDGFLSAANQREPGIYDFAPWQSTEVLALALVRFCRQSPKIKFHMAVNAMAGQLRGDALTTAAPAIVAKHKGKVILIYKPVLETLQRRLEEKGLLKAGFLAGEFDKRTIEAIEAFQRSEKLPVTGVPDQFTLAGLLGR